MLRSPCPCAPAAPRPLAPLLFSLVACGGGPASSTGSTSGGGGADAGPNFSPAICHSVDTKWKQTALGEGANAA